jgi:K+-transporting ATPase A subunit
MKNNYGPPTLTWLLMKVFLIITPMSILINIMLISIGIPDTIFTYLSSWIIAFFLSGIYDRITFDVGKYLEQHDQDSR